MRLRRLARKVAQLHIVKRRKQTLHDRDMDIHFFELRRQIFSRFRRDALNVFDFFIKFVQSCGRRNGSAGRGRGRRRHKFVYAEFEKIGHKFVFVSEFFAVRFVCSADFRNQFGIVKPNGMLNLKIFHAALSSVLFFSALSS